MSSPRILHLETATNVCSVALSEGGNLVSIRESREDRSHGSLLTVFMEEVIREAGLQPKDIDAISISKGPGSYTGLRIGVSVAKGFAYASDIPVIGINTLQALSCAAMNNEKIKELCKSFPKLLLCPMIDARRMEVYTALYDQNSKEVSPVEAKIVNEDSFKQILESSKIVFFGNGSEKVKEIITHPSAFFIEDISPSSRYMLPLALDSFSRKSFENTAYFEPFYLKDFVATIPKNKML